MDDPHRAPRDRDRSALSDRIRRAAAEGRISAADRDIRLRNVASAQSITELDLIARDLDVLEATLSAGSATPTPPRPSEPLPGTGPAASRAVDALVDRDRGRFRPALVVGVVIAVFAIVGASALAYFATSFGDDDNAGSASGETLFTPDPIESPGADPSAEPGDGPADEPVDEPDPESYALTAAGIRGFLAGYRHKFGTPMVVNLVMYPDYAVVQVPQANRSRHAGLLYRKGNGWTDFGGISANFPGSRPVDLRRLDVDALVKNIARARRTLHVEKPTQTYVIVQHLGAADPVPSVDIHVGNEFNESGYLATRLDGTVERAFPYGG